MAGPALDYPLRVREGRFLTVEQGSARHVEVMAEISLRTTQGQLEAQPKTGRRDLVGRVGPVGPVLLDSLADDVPGVEFILDEDRDRIAERLTSVAVSLGGQP